MMAQSAEAERRREAAKRARSECRDTAVDSMMQIWEHDILPRWNDAIRERRTRELWWRGVAPRVRGAVWTRAIGNELGLTDKSFHAALTRAQDVEARVKAGKGTAEDMRNASWFEAIRKDVEEGKIEMTDVLRPDFVTPLTCVAKHAGELEAGSLPKPATKQKSKKRGGQK